jgi:hypothetical protein
MSVAQLEVAHEQSQQSEVIEATALQPIDPEHIVKTTQSPILEATYSSPTPLSREDILRYESELNVHIEGAFTDLMTKFSFATHAFDQLRKIVRAIAWSKAHPDKPLHVPPPNLHYTTENLALMSAKVHELIHMMDHAGEEGVTPVSGGSIDHVAFNIARRIMYLANKENIDEATEGLEDKFKYPNVYIGKQLNDVIRDVFLRIYFVNVEENRKKLADWLVSTMANITACPDLVHINYEIPFNTKVVVKTDKLHKMEIYANVKQFIDTNRRSEECMKVREESRKEFDLRRAEYMKQHPEKFAHLRRPIE